MVLSSLYYISASIYNYLAGYVKVNCKNCNGELTMYYKDVIPNIDISCSHGCTFELYNKYCKLREEK